MVNSFRLSARFFWREWRAGQWFIVFFAVLIAVSGITALDFYSDRLKRGIEENNAKFLGGDLVINSSTPIPKEWLQWAKNLNIHTAQVWSYPSVVKVNNKMQLINLLAVSDNYPLLGENQRPEKQTVWIESRLLSSLSLNLNAALTIGAAQFTVAKILKSENALFDSGWLIAPRAMILLSDVPATKTVLPGSRVNYRLLLTGNSADIQAFKEWVNLKLKPDQRLFDVHNQEQRLVNIINQVENFLQLALLISVAMCCIAIVLSIQRYLHEHYAYAALLRSLGAKQKQIIYHYLFKLIIIACTAGSLGVFIGYFAQNILAKLFQEYLQIALPAPGFKPMLFGFLLSSALLFIFAYPIINVLPKISPLFLWRNELSVTTQRNNFYFVAVFIALMFFIYSFTGFSILTLLFLNFMGLCVAFLYALSLLFLSILQRILHKTSGVWRRGLSQLVQYPDNTSLQFISFTLTLMLIMVLSMTRMNLLQNWQESFAQKTPNYFAINIAPTDLNSFQKIMNKNQVELAGIYPMIRGRLTGLNNQPIMQAIPESARDNNALHRELNLTWMENFPLDNKLVGGDPWPVNHQGEPLISVEKKLADDLQLKIGDALTFQIGEKNITAKIINFRTVSWASFHPNFFVIFTPGVINHFSTTYITSFHLADAQNDFLNQLVQHFPNITIIDVANLLKQVQDIISRITYASQYLLIFALCAALLVLLASLQTSLDERKIAYRLWRVLGASKNYIYQSILIEFSSIVFIVIFFAYFFAKLFVYLIELKFFNV